MTSEAKRNYARDRRARLRAARRCTDCAAGLQARDGVRCVECAELARKRMADYRQRNPETLSAWRRRRRAAKPDDVRAEERATYLRKKLEGVCIDCKMPSLEDSIFCAEHRARRNAATKRFRERATGRAAA